MHPGEGTKYPDGHIRETIKQLRGQSIRSDGDEKSEDEKSEDEELELTEDQLEIDESREESKYKSAMELALQVASSEEELAEAVQEIAEKNNLRYCAGDLYKECKGAFNNG